MPSNRIAACFVEVVAKGLSQVQAGLSSVKNALGATSKAGDALRQGIRQTSANLQQLSSQFGQFAQAATASFAVATAGITGFVKAADPHGFLQLQMVMARISVQLGSVFLPILDDVTAGLNELLTFFRGLSDEQKDQIALWTEVALAIGAFVLVGGKLIAVLKLATGAFKLLGLAIGVATGGIVPIIGAVVSLAAGLFMLSDGLGEAGEQGSFLGSILETVQPVIDTISEAFQRVWAIVQPILATFLERAIEFAQGLIETFSAFMERLEPIWDAVSSIIGGAVGVLIELFSTLFDSAGPIFEALIDLTVFFGDVFKEAFSIAGELVTELGVVLQALKPVAEAIFEALKTGVRSLKPVFEFVFGTIKALIRGVIDTIVYLSTLLREVGRGNFLGAHSKAKEAVKAYNEKLDDAEKKAGEKIKGRVQAGKEMAGNVAGAVRDGRAGDMARGAFQAAKGKAGELTGRMRPELPGRKEREEKEGTRRHAPTQMIAKPELMDVVSAWKKAQTSIAQTPEQAAREEQLKLMKEGNQHLAKIAENTEEEPGWDGIGEDEM